MEKFTNERYRDPGAIKKICSNVKCIRAAGRETMEQAV
jgi:hypothetical protein